MFYNLPFAKIRISEREISSLLEYFSQRAEVSWSFSSKIVKGERESSYKRVEKFIFTQRAQKNLDKIKYQVYLNIFHSERKYLGASKIENKLQRLFFEIHPVEFQ